MPQVQVGTCHDIRENLEGKALVRARNDSLGFPKGGHFESQTRKRAWDCGMITNFYYMKKVTENLKGFVPGPHQPMAIFGTWDPPRLTSNGRMQTQT